jgi:hypothetical protein
VPKADIKIGSIIRRGSSGSLAMFAAITTKQVIDSARCQPSRSSIGAVFRPRVKGDGGSRSGPMDRINNRLKIRKALKRQADTSADYNTGIVCGSQVTFHRLPSRSIRTNPADIALPSSVRHLLKGTRHTGAYLLSAHARR